MQDNNQSEQNYSSSLSQKTHSLEVSNNSTARVSPNNFSPLTILYRAILILTVAILVMFLFIMLLTLSSPYAGYFFILMAPLVIILIPLLFCSIVFTVSFLIALVVQNLRKQRASTNKLAVASNQQIRELGVLGLTTLLGLIQVLFLNPDSGLFFSAENIGVKLNVMFFYITVSIFLLVIVVFFSRLKYRQ